MRPTDDSYFAAHSLRVSVILLVRFRCSEPVLGRHRRHELPMRASRDRRLERFRSIVVSPHPQLFLVAETNASILFRLPCDNCRYCCRSNQIPLGKRMRTR